MNRKSFIKTSIKAGIGLLLAPQLIGRNRNVQNELERKLLSEFLLASEKPHISKREIENILYDISEIDSKGNIATKGRAAHLGDNYFLTAYHVVDSKTSNLKLIPQWRRGYVHDFHQGFDLVEYDAECDLALLKTADKKLTGEVNFHLGSKIPSLNEDISTFIRLTGKPPKKNYEFEYGGKDFYDHSQKVAYLGKLILPAQSLLLEKQGKVLRYDETYLNQVGGSHKGKSENEIFTSVASFSGESGQPMFLKVDDNKYIFTGVLTGVYGIEYVIPTPNDPLKYDSMPQVGAFFTHRDTIQRLIKKYVKRIS